MDGCSKLTSTDCATVWTVMPLSDKKTKGHKRSCKTGKDQVKCNPSGVRNVSAKPHFLNHKIGTQPSAPQPND